MFNVSQAAAYLDVCRVTIFRWRRLGYLPPRAYFTKDELDGAWKSIPARRRTAQNEPDPVNPAQTSAKSA